VRWDWSGPRLGAVSHPPGTPSPAGRIAMATRIDRSGYSLFDAADRHVIGTWRPT